MRVARRPNEKRIVRRAAEKQVRRSLVLGLRVKTNEAPCPCLNQAFPHGATAGCESLCRYAWIDGRANDGQVRQWRRGLRPAQLEGAAGAIGAVHRHPVSSSRDRSEGQAAVQIVSAD